MAHSKLNDWKKALSDGPFGPSAEGFHVNDGDIVFCIDGSASMDNMHKFLQNALQMLKPIMNITCMDEKTHVLFYSDYDSGSFVIDKSSVAIAATAAKEPEWFDCIRSFEFETLSHADQTFIKSKMNNYLELLQAAKDRPSIDNNLVTMWETSLSSYFDTYPEQAEPEQVIPVAVTAGSTLKYMEKRVFSYGGSGLDNVIQSITNYKSGETISGNGGDAEEASKTAMLLVASAALRNITNQTSPKVNMIFMGDVTPHVYYMTTENTYRENDTLKLLGLPHDMNDILKLIEHLGHRLCWLTPGDLYSHAGRICYSYDLVRSGTFVTNYLMKYDNTIAIYHQNFMCDQSVFASVLLTALRVMMTGEYIAPWDFTGDNNKDQIETMMTKLKCDNIAAQNVITTQLGPFMRMVVRYKTKMTSMTMPRIVSSAIDINRQILDAFMDIMNHDPKLLAFTPYLAPMFYKAKASASTDVHQRFVDFMTKMAKDNKSQSALINAYFVEAKLNNRFELEEALDKLYNELHLEPLELNDMVIVYDAKEEKDFLPRDTFSEMSKYLHVGMIRPLMDALKRFKLMRLEDAGKAGIDIDQCVTLADRRYLPAKALGNNGKYLHVVWSLAMNNVTMPPVSAAFKIAVIMLAQGTNAGVNPLMRMSAYTLVKNNFMKFLAFILDDTYEIRDDKNPLVAYSWWLQPIAVTLLIKVMETMHDVVTPNQIQRFVFINRVVTAQKRLNDKVSFDVEKTKTTHAKAGRLLMCPSGEWIPETIFIKAKQLHKLDTNPWASPCDLDCVYCEGVHGEYNDEGNARNKYAGTQYHQDGTPQVFPSPNFNPFGQLTKEEITEMEKRIGSKFLHNICLNDSMDTICYGCGAHYSVLDSPCVLTGADGKKHRRGRGAHMPRCYNCRQYKGGHRKQAPIRNCVKCHTPWVFGTPNDNWMCVYCEYGDKLAYTDTYRAQAVTTVFELLKDSSNESLLFNYASNFGLTVTVLKVMFKMMDDNKKLQSEISFLGMMRLPIKDLLQEPTKFDTTNYSDIFIPIGTKLTGLGDWPFENHVNETTVYTTICNMDTVREQLANIKEQRLRDVCSLGLCEAEDHPLADMVSLCGECTFLTCKGCVRSMTQNRPGSIIPVSRLICPCGRAICQNTLHKIGRGNQKILQDAMYAMSCGKGDHRIALCCGGTYPEIVDRKETGRFVVQCRGIRYSLLPPYNGVCGADNPDDDVTDYRCPTCLEAEEMYHIHLAEEAAKKEALRRRAFEETAEDLEEIKASYPAGTRLRRCPKCKAPTEKSTNMCAHMTCATCRTHWCWICGMDCGTSGATYDHMNESERHANTYHGERYHQDTYNVTPHTPIHDDNNVSEIIMC